MTSILSIRDPNTNQWIEIPAIAGSPGKSVYDFAKEGGYSGTEEEFALLLASVNNIDVDPTLSIEGGAAEAKATGEAITAITNDALYENLYNSLNENIEEIDPYLTLMEQLQQTQNELAETQNNLFNAQFALEEAQSEMDILINSLFYKPGDSINIHIHTCGVLTADTKKVYFTIPIARPMKNITQCTQNLTFQVRQNGKYLMGTADTWVPASDFTFDLTDGNNLIGVIHFNSAPSGAINNDAVTVSAHGTITFQ